MRIEKSADADTFGIAPAPPRASSPESAPSSNAGKKKKPKKKEPLDRLSGIANGKPLTESLKKLQNAGADAKPLIARIKSSVSVLSQSLTMLQEEHRKESAELYLIFQNISETKSARPTDRRAGGPVEAIRETGSRLLFRHD